MKRKQPDRHNPEIVEFARVGDYDGVEELLRCGMADVNTEIWGGLTALHASASHDLRITEFLIRRGANVNAKAEDGETPLHVALRYGRLEESRSLIEHGADLHVGGS